MLRARACRQLQPWWLRAEKPSTKVSRKQRALTFCWVSTGSVLKHYALLTGLPQGHGPLAPAIHFRDKIAHQPLDRLASEIVWETSVRDAPKLQRVIEALMNDLAD